MKSLAQSWMTFSLVLFALSGLLFATVPIDANAQSTISDQYDDILSQGIIFAGICSGADAACECRDDGRCTLENGLQVMVNVSVFILGISGTVLLLMFVYGGMVWIFSAGRSDWVDKGKNTLVGALVGLGIIFGAYVAINVIISVLKTGDIPETGNNIEDTIGDGAEDIVNTE